MMGGATTQAPPPTICPHTASSPEAQGVSGSFSFSLGQEVVVFTQAAALPVCKGSELPWTQTHQTHQTPLCLFGLSVTKLTLDLLVLCCLILSHVSVFSPHVVRYYGSYFKNSDLWIVMEYCGAGSVSDLIRIRNKTVSQRADRRTHTARPALWFI